MWRSVPILALVLGLLMSSGAIAGEAKAVIKVGITITGKDPNAKPVVAPAGQKSAVQSAGKPAFGK